jgi:hypothetical protein
MDGIPVIRLNHVAFDRVTQRRLPGDVILGCTDKLIGSSQDCLGMGYEGSHTLSLPYDLHAGKRTNLSDRRGVGMTLDMPRVRE